MSKAQKNSLVKNRVYLIKSIIPDQNFFSYLRGGNHLSESMQQDIMVCTQNIYTHTQSFYCFSAICPELPG